MNATTRELYTIMKETWDAIERGIELMNRDNEGFVGRVFVVEIGEESELLLKLGQLRQ